MLPISETQAYLNNLNERKQNLEMQLVEVRAAINAVRYILHGDE